MVGNPGSFWTEYYSKTDAERHASSNAKHRAAWASLIAHFEGACPELGDPELNEHERCEHVIEVIRDHMPEE